MQLKHCAVPFSPVLLHWITGETLNCNAKGQYRQGIWAIKDHLTLRSLINDWAHVRLKSAPLYPSFGSAGLLRLQRNEELLRITESFRLSYNSISVFFSRIEKLNKVIYQRKISIVCVLFSRASCFTMTPIIRCSKCMPNKIWNAGKRISCAMACQNRFTMRNRIWKRTFSTINSSISVYCKCDSNLRRLW